MPIFARNILIACCAALALLSGCSLINDKKPPPRPSEFHLESPYVGVRTLAVAPTINLSGSRDFDPLVVSDTLFVELQQVQNLNVLPLNKTLMAMNRLGMRSIDDAKAAQKLAEALGADGLVIPAVTAYDPYKPPTVGMILQLYTPPTSEIHATVPVKLEPIQTNRSDITVSTDNRPPAPTQQPAAQVAAVFNANNQTVLRELRDFSMGRTQYDSALIDQKFLVDSEAYMRFVCHAMVRRLMEVERIRAADR